MLGLIILTVHFVVSAWKRDIPSFEPLDLSNGNITFDPNFVSATHEPAASVTTLRRVHYVSPFDSIRDYLGHTFCPLFG
ncbi:hypothetical protein F5887DRAFT_969498 [Amanita rubescens]|nr:hypothetical protein F5887DRAFT_969498 [Amanita rubescens]